MGLLATALWAVSVGAQAHGSAQGVNSFYGGLLHPLQSGAQVLVLLGLGIWLGQRPPLRLKLPMLVFCTGCALALLLTSGIAGPPPVPSPAWLMGLSMCFGVLIASRAAAPGWLSAALAAGAALAVGLDAGVDGLPPPTTLALILLGSWISSSALLANVAYYVSACPRREWVEIGIRIVGSWLAAASILMLAFYFKAR